MFDKFGEFDSAEEINQAAAGLKAEGDNDNILIIAKENGLDQEFAQAYIDGEIPELTNTLMAAVGKIELERKNVKAKLLSGITDDLVNYILTSCMDNQFASTVRKKGKSLNECLSYCEKKLTEIAKQQAKGERSIGLSVRNTDVYSMEKDYYMKESGE
jgi:hypothetical protein